jgi:hypothetical protein
MMPLWSRGRQFSIRVFYLSSERNYIVDDKEYLARQGNFGSMKYASRRHRDGRHKV